jgi:hypothetical protein
MDEDPLPIIGIKRFILLIVIGILFPTAVSPGFAIMKEPCTTCAWDYGTIKAPVLLRTIKRPDPRPLQQVKYFGNGTCVPYARYRTGIQLYGWARYFLKWAKEEGYSTSTVPIIGGMVITNESRGHVAVVEDVHDDHIHISEQNFLGRYVISKRELSLDDPRILGYIY